jgi:hypothetical protein
MEVFTPSTVPVVAVGLMKDAGGKFVKDADEKFQGAVIGISEEKGLAEVNQQRANLGQEPLDVDCPAESFSSTISLVGDTGSGTIRRLDRPLTTDS